MIDKKKSHLGSAFYDIYLCWSTIFICFTSVTSIWRIFQIHEVLFLSKIVICRRWWNHKIHFCHSFYHLRFAFSSGPNRAKPNSTNSAPLWVCQLSEPCPSWSSFSSKHTLSIAFVTRSSVNSLNSQVGSLRAQNGLCQSPLLGAALSTLKLVIFTDSVNHLC